MITSDVDVVCHLAALAGVRPSLDEPLRYLRANITGTGVIIERMRAHPLDKDESARDTAPLRRLFTRSIVARQALAAGTQLSREHLVFKKPGTGLAPSRVDEVIGRRLARDVTADQPLVADDIEGLANQ